MFISRGQSLKEELMGRTVENNDKNNNENSNGRNSSTELVSVFLSMLSSAYFSV